MMMTMVMVNVNKNRIFNINKYDFKTINNY